MRWQQSELKGKKKLKIATISKNITLIFKSDPKYICTYIFVHTVKVQSVIKDCVTWYWEL